MIKSRIIIRNRLGRSSIHVGTFLSLFFQDLFSRHIRLPIKSIRSPGCPGSAIACNSIHNPREAVTMPTDVRIECANDIVASCCCWREIKRREE